MTTTQHTDTQRARFVWTRSALDGLAAGKTDPRHTISAPNITEVYDGFVRQLRPGTPWVLLSSTDEVLARG